MPNEIQHISAACGLAREELQQRVEILHEELRACHLCPHACEVDRLAGEMGRCRTGAAVRIASVCDHHGEEPAISGRSGSGTVFVAGCNLCCVYCQNHQISQGDLEQYPTPDAETLAETFLRLQHQGCHNLNWVSPTHVVPQLVEALALAIDRGLHLPVVYNSNGYDSVPVLRLLDGIVDIHLPDLKYADSEVAKRLSSASEYPDAALAAIREMYRQVGDLVLGHDDVAVRGVIVRHLVLPGHLAGSHEILRRLAEEVSPTVTISLMAQYYPTHHALAIPELSRTITAEEYEDALDAFAHAGLENGWAQEVHTAPENYRPDFSVEHPFKG